MLLLAEAGELSSAGAPLLTTPPSNSNATRQVDDITTTNLVRLFINFCDAAEDEKGAGSNSLFSLGFRYFDYMTIPGVGRNTCRAPPPLLSTQQENRGLSEQVRESLDMPRPGEKVAALDREVILAAQILEVINTQDMDIR